MPKSRRITVVTGTRAEFGLLEPVMRAIVAHRSLALYTVVTGTHLVAETWRDVRVAGFGIDAKIVMQKPGEVGRDADAAALGRGVAGLAKVFARQSPDFVIVLGDRVEVLAAASAAAVGGHRVAQLHAGDRAEGIADEAMRHAVSKLAHLLLPATAQSRRRLIRMGEAEPAVINVGSPAIDMLHKVKLADDAPELIVLQHPIGASDEQEYRWMTATLRATQRYERTVLMPNHDPGSEGIRAAIRDAGIKPIEHLPRERFLSSLAGTKAIVGNSSAGLIEAAALLTPCVNLGPRQGGRERPRNVIDAEYGEKAIRRAVKLAMRQELSRLRHPYGDGHTGLRVADLLADIDFDAVPLRKRNTY